MVWSRDVQRATRICERFPWTDGDWNHGSSPDVISCDGSSHCTFTTVGEGRCEQVRSWFTMLLWWTPYHHDFGGMHSKRSPGLHFGCLHAVFIERRLSDYLCKCCIVWSRDTHTSHCHIWRYFVQKCWCAYGTCSVLLYVIRSHGWSLLHSYCMFLWWTPYHQDLRGFLWQVMVGMVDAIHVCFCDGLLKTATFSRKVPWRKQTTPPGFLEDICTRVWLTWCFLDCEEVPARIIAIFAQFGLVIHTIGLHTCKTFPLNTWLHGGILFSCLVCAAEQSFVLLLHCVVLWRTSYHHDVREARSQKLGITWW